MTSVLFQPDDPLATVVTLFGVSLGLAVARTHGSLVRFYESWSTSGLEMSKHRGYGQSACRLYGTRKHWHQTMLSRTAAAARSRIECARTFAMFTSQASFRHQSSL